MQDLTKLIRSYDNDTERFAPRNWEEVTRERRRLAILSEIERVEMEAAE